MANDIQFSVSGPGADSVVKTLQDLAKKRLLIGIPADNKDRTDKVGNPVGVSNILLGFVHEFGSPANNIPDRPFLRPGVKDAMPQIVDRLKQAAEAAASNRSEDAVDARLNQAGIVAVRSVQARIRRGIPPPLKPATIAARRIRTPGSPYRRKAQARQDVTPLYDTGQLLRSITSVIRKTK